MSDIKVVADYSDLQLMRRELVGVSKDAKASASVFEREFNKVERQLNANAKAAQAWYQKQDLANKSARDSASVFRKQAEEINRNTAAISQFRSAYDQSYAVEQKTLQLKALLRQAIANETMTVREAGAELLRYRQALIASGHAQTKFGKTMNRTGVLSQQAGYQVGDFLVQVQSGTNPMVAFGQQATQMVGALYYLPPAALSARISLLGMSTTLGAMIPVLGIAIPLATALGAAWMRTRQETDSSSKSIDVLKQNLESLASTYEDWDRARRAAFAGVSVDEFLSLESLRQAQQEFDVLRQKATEAFDAISTEDDGYDLAAAEKHAELKEQTAAAQERLAEAEKVVADIRRKAAVERSASASEEAASFAATLQSYREELQLSQAILEYGKDSVQVADLKRQHYLASVIAAAAEATEVESARQAMVELAMEAYDAKIAIDNSADAAARMGEGFNAAIDKIRQMTSEINGFYGALHAGGLDVSALEAQLTALQGGATTAQAAGEALRTQLMGSQLAKDILSGGSVGEQATFLAGVNQRVADEVRRRELQASIGEFGKTSSSSGGKTEAETLQDNLDKLLETLATQELLNGKTDAQRQIIQALGSNYQAVDATILEALEQKINKQAELNREIEKQQSIADTIQSSMSDAFMSMVDGTKSAKDAFRDMARDIIKQLYDVLVVQQLVGSWNAQTGTGTGLAGMIMGAFQADGGVWSSGRQVNAFASGGVVSGPTMFPMAGGQTGLMGEAGPEAIMPLKRGPDGKLGVQAEGQGSVNIVQNFSFSANGDDSVKRIIAQAAPQIAQMTQKQIMDSRRRGGQMKSVFS